MAADAPTILATSGGMIPGTRVRFEVGPLTDYAIDLSGAAGKPKVCYLASALGDSAESIRNFYDAARLRGLEASHLALFPMPNIEDTRAHLLDQDVIWVGGGSVAGLLAMWYLHGVDAYMREAWQAGVVLTGVSAGSICWHVGGSTDSFGPDLRPVTNGLALVPFSNGVHYDSEQQRRPIFHELIGAGTLPAGYATEDGVGVLYRGQEFVEALTERKDKAAYWVGPNSSGGVDEHRLPTRLL